MLFKRNHFIKSNKYSIQRLISITRESLPSHCTETGNTM